MQGKTPQPLLNAKLHKKRTSPLFESAMPLGPPAKLPCEAAEARESEAAQPIRVVCSLSELFARQKPLTGLRRPEMTGFLDPKYHPLVIHWQPCPVQWGYPDRDNYSYRCGGVESFSKCKALDFGFALIL